MYGGRLPSTQHADGAALGHNVPVMLVLLPGMDGTGTLFEPFIRRLPRQLRVKIVRYSEHKHLNYQQLSDCVRGDLPTREPYVIVAESYSGPVALSLAAAPVGDLRAIVLVSSFASRPLGTLAVLAARLPLSRLLPERAPEWVLRWLLLDQSTPQEVVAAVREAIRRVRPEVLAARIQDALAVDCADLIERCAVRLVCLLSAKDRLLRPCSTEAFRRAAHKAEVVMIPAPHLLLQCAPDAAVAVLTRLGLLNDSEGHAECEE